MHRSLARFLANEDGVALVEFAVSLPVLLLVFTGIVELSRYALYMDKLDTAAMQSLEVINRSLKVQSSDLHMLYSQALPELIKPFSDANFSMVVTMVVWPLKTGQTCSPRAAWQWKSGVIASQVAPGKNAKANIGLVPLMPNDYVVTVELEANYKPLLNVALLKDWFNGNRNYTLVYGRPRYGAFGRDPQTGVAVNPPCSA